MTHKVYSITDLGPGDGGKGGVVEAVAEKVHAHAIIKEGGAQGSHGVVLSDGRKFNFSQWGCATFQGVPTYLSDRFVMSPIGLLAEAKALRDVGIYNGFGLISASPDCICASPYHQAWSRLYELSLRDHPHGTVGTGIGKAYKQSETDPDLVLRARMLHDEAEVRKMISLQREYVQTLFASMGDEDVLPGDIDLLHENLALLESNEAFEDIVEKTVYAGKILRLRELRDVLRHDGVAVVERSHGVLTDSECGLKPHVSSLRTLPFFTLQSLSIAGFSGQLVNLGVHRAYEIRHGAGPIPTAMEELKENLLPGSHKDTNRWQGEVRVGALDFVLMNYALDCCEGIKGFDGLCLTWFDQILNFGTWPICLSYTINGNMILPHTKLNARMMSLAQPDLSTFDISSRLHDPNNRDDAFEFCRELVESFINIPLRLLSFGARKEDKFFK